MARSQNIGPLKMYKIVFQLCVYETSKRMFRFKAHSLCIYANITKFKKSAVWNIWFQAFQVRYPHPVFTYVFVSPVLSLEQSSVHEK
jgi:hypothetical protein